MITVTACNAGFVGLSEIIAVFRSMSGENGCRKASGYPQKSYRTRPKKPSETPQKAIRKSEYFLTMVQPRRRWRDGRNGRQDAFPTSCVRRGQNKKIIEVIEVTGRNAISVIEQQSCRYRHAPILQLAFYEFVIFGLCANVYAINTHFDCRNTII